MMMVGPPLAYLTTDADTPLYYFVDFIPGSAYGPLFNVKPTKPSDHTLVHIRNIAKWFIERETVNFDKVGGLHYEMDGAISVGPVIDRFIQSGEPPFYHGPFNTPRERYTSVFDTAMKQILDGTRTRPQHALWDYLTALEMKTLLTQCAELDGDEKYYIKHGEDKGDHFMFDEAGEITGVIDWDW